MTKVVVCSCGAILLTFKGLLTDSPLTSEMTLHTESICIELHLASAVLAELLKRQGAGEKVGFKEQT